MCGALTRPNFLQTLNKEEEMLKADTCEDEMNETAGLADAALSDKRGNCNSFTSTRPQVTILCCFY